MNRRFNPARASSERGSAMVELALIIPVLLLLIISTIEYSNTLRIAEAAVFLSRETANLIHRSCRSLTDRSPSSLAACMKNAADTIADSAAGVHPELAIVVSVYRWEEPALILSVDSLTSGTGLGPAAGRAVLLAKEASSCPPNRRCPVPDSRLSADLLNGSVVYREALEQVEDLFFAEVWVRADSFTGGVVTRFIGYESEPYYAVGVF